MKKKTLTIALSLLSAVCIGLLPGCSTQKEAASSEVETTVAVQSSAEETTGAVAEDPEDPEDLQPQMEDIESIQAYTDGTIYGTAVVQVDVTYKQGTDLSKVTADSYILEDRGSLNPDFGEVAIKEATVKDNVVTLIMDNASGATSNNDLIYSVKGAGVRERCTYGTVVTGNWYRNPEGTIFYGEEDSENYQANITGMGYQARPCLELKLRHANESIEDAACLADEKGQFNSNGIWKETINRQFGEDGFQSFAEGGIQIESTANSDKITDGTGDEYVRGYYYVPENYNPENGIVFTLQGFGICYWKLPDGSDNEGAGIMCDTATTSWKNTGAIIVQIHDRSAAGPGEYFSEYDFVLDDVNVMKYFIDTYHVTGNIVLQGNSRGTSASCILIRALAGKKYSPYEQGYDRITDYQIDKVLDKNEYNFTIDTYICQNGTFGEDPDFDEYLWSDDDWRAIIETGMKAWVFDGEQDTNMIASVKKWAEMGGDPEKVRLTGYPSDIYYYWGETDHATTRINGWYFADKGFYGPDVSVDPESGELVYKEKLADGDTYTLPARGAWSGSDKDGYEYTVYDDSFHTWALK